MKKEKNYLKCIGERIRQYRINENMTQQELAEQTGISVRTISRFEQGASIQLDALIKILDALNLADNIELLIPDQTKNPFYYVENKSNRRQRVSKKRNDNTGFKWGDDE